MLETKIKIQEQQTKVNDLDKLIEDISIAIEDQITILKSTSLFKILLKRKKLAVIKQHKADLKKWYVVREEAREELADLQVLLNHYIKDARRSLCRTAKNRSIHSQ